MWQQLCDLIEAARGRHVLVVGDFMIDRYLYGDAERISPEAPVPVIRVVRREATVGGAGSVAADIAALGCVPHCVGIVGRDANSELMDDLLNRVGADPSGLVRVDGRPTTEKTRLVGLAQHRHRQQLIRVDDEITDPVDAATTAELQDRIAALLGSCAAICIEDYCKGVVSSSLMGSIIEAAKVRGIPVLVDPAPIDSYDLYAGATIVTPNRTETERLIGRRLMDIDAVRESAGRIREACGSECVCVTLDAHGAALISADGGFEHIPTKPRDVYDVTGAGDAVLAAIAVATAAGASMRQAVTLANVAGGLEVEKFGCVPVTRDEIIGELLTEHHKELGKIRAVGDLLPELDRRKSRGETVAFTNGCFDLLHVGHVRSFAFCKQHADIVVVGLNSDASVRRQDKAEDRPIVSQDARAEVLASLSDIDYVVLFDEDTPQALIESVRPEVLVKGEDYAGKFIAGETFVKANGGKVVLFPVVAGQSTTGLIDRIRRPVDA